MIKARVIIPLNIRSKCPAILPYNNIADQYFNSGDTIEIATQTLGEKYKNNNIWYQLTNGGYVWSGGVETPISTDNLLSANSQTELNEILKKTWQHTRGESCTVAVVDSGVDYNHPFMFDRIKAQGSFSFMENNVQDAFNCKNNHGTTMSGLICGNNATQYIGYAPMATIKSIKVFDSVIGDANMMAENLDKALTLLLQDNELDVINLSLQFDPRQISETLKQGVYKKIDLLTEKGVIVLAASGNNGFVAFPGICNSVITVGVLNKGIDLKSFSNGITFPSETGKSVDIFLPTYENNVIIPKTPVAFPYEGHESSEATALFSALVALKKSFDKKYTQTDLKRDIDKNKIYLSQLPNLTVYKLDIGNFLKIKS